MTHFNVSAAVKLQTFISEMGRFLRILDDFEKAVDFYDQGMDNQDIESIEVCIHFCAKITKRRDNIICRAKEKVSRKSLFVTTVTFALLGSK